MSVSVKLGTSTQLTSADLDAVFDKIAELHTDSALNLTYNTAGRNAVKSALDCIFDAEHLTVSAIWTNENDGTLAVRSYTGVVMDGGSPVGELEFEQVETYSGDTYIRLKPVGGDWTSSVLEVSTLGSNDYFGIVTSQWTKCWNADCGGTCVVELSTGFCGSCAEGCTTVFGGGDGGNGMIVKWIDPHEW